MVEDSKFPLENGSAAPRQPVGKGGWLLVLGSALVLSVLHGILAINTSPSIDIHTHYPVLWFSFAYRIFLLVFFVYILYLYLQEKKLFLYAGKFVLLFPLLMPIIDYPIMNSLIDIPLGMGVLPEAAYQLGYCIISLICYIDTPSLTGYIWSFIRAILFGVLVNLYISRSARVRNTFVR